MADWGLRTTPTFYDGVLMVGNAIPDSVIVYAGGPCVDEQVRGTFAAHDHAQTLGEFFGEERLVSTFTDSSMTPMGITQELEETVTAVVEARAPALVILAELPSLTIGGNDLEQYAHTLGERLPCPVVCATSRFLARDYSHAVSSLCSRVWRAACPRKRSSCPWIPWRSAWWGICTSAPRVTTRATSWSSRAWSRASA